MFKHSYLLVALMVTLIFSVSASAAIADALAPALYPDLRTVVPKHLQLVNQQQREELRFTNGLANTGDGPWAMRPQQQGNQTYAIQEIRAADGSLVTEHLAGVYVFHPTHNHWHIGDVALFEVHADSPTGPLIGSSVKVGFCLIDAYKLEDNSPSWERTFWDCETSYQGVSPGWVDQYHQALDGQSVDITGAPDGIYYLVNTVNPLSASLEKDYTNNSAWVKFRLYGGSNGNRKIEVVAHSPCEGAGMCGDFTANR